MGTTFPGESAEYREARDRLLEREAELSRATEDVAAARRELPPGGVVPEDYAFQGAGADGEPADVRLSELFAPGKDTLAIYNFMFPRALDEDLPCPHCTSFLDAFDGAAGHVSQRVNLAVVAKAELPRILAHADKRGWGRLRLLSSGGNTYNRHYHGESSDGSQLFAPTAPGQDPRHSDSIDPQWGLFDFTPEGRGNDWYPELSYGD
jgi:predicted dithiol-disulfide oxidoreductase (DUF899 family)